MLNLHFHLVPNLYRPCFQLKSTAGNLLTQRASVKLFTLASSFKSCTLRSSSKITCMSTLHPDVSGDDAVTSMPSLSIKANQQDDITNASAKLPKVIIITGPTAVGKTAVGLRLAQILGGEIISADSVQVYRTLDVGSDKIVRRKITLTSHIINELVNMYHQSIDEYLNPIPCNLVLQLPFDQREGIPHHLIDIAEVAEDFNAGDFFDHARAATADILSRGKVPIIVGGTGLYLKWFVHGKALGERAPPHVMEAVQKEIAEAQAAAQAISSDALTQEERWDAAVELLRVRGDTQAADRISLERNNYYRLERALSILHMNPGSTLAAMDISITAPLDYDFRPFFLHRPRLELYDRIALRIEQMVFGGLLDEAAELLRLGGEPGTNMAGRAIGYRQALEFLQAHKASGKAVAASDLVALIAVICTATHKLVRSQMTWFRDQQLYHWMDVAPLDAAGAADGVLKELNREEHAGGNCGSSGRLDKVEQKAMVRYRAPAQLMAEPIMVENLLRHINNTLLEQFTLKPPPIIQKSAATLPSALGTLADAGAATAGSESAGTPCTAESATAAIAAVAAAAAAAETAEVADITDTISAIEAPTSKAFGAEV